VTTKAKKTAASIINIPGARTLPANPARANLLETLFAERFDRPYSEHLRKIYVMSMAKTTSRVVHVTTSTVEIVLKRPSIVQAPSE
jgi:hypothetical protein